MCSVVKFDCCSSNLLSLSIYLSILQAALYDEAFIRMQEDQEAFAELMAECAQIETETAATAMQASAEPEEVRLLLLFVCCERYRIE